MSSLRFEIEAKCAKTGAWAGLLHTAHGTIETPVFMPVGTQGTVKGLSPRDLIGDLDAKIILANTYHLFLRPGHERIESMGGLHKFMSWLRAILTNSGDIPITAMGSYRSDMAPDLLSLMSRGFRAFGQITHTACKRPSASLRLPSRPAHSQSTTAIAELWCNYSVGIRLPSSRGTHPICPGWVSTVYRWISEQGQRTTFSSGSLRFETRLSSPSPRRYPNVRSRFHVGTRLAWLPRFTACTACSMVPPEHLGNHSVPTLA
jgi:hypothetical protein